MKIIEIKISGISYPIRVKGGEEERYIKKLARYVDSKMKRLAPAGSQVLSSKLAVKAALDIADELHRLKKEKELTVKAIGQRCKKLSRLLDQGLR